MARVTTRYSAAWTTFWLVTIRTAPRIPRPPTMTKAISCALTGSSLGLLPSGPDGGGLGPPLGHPAVGALGQLLGQDAVERLAVGLDLVALRRRAGRRRPRPRGPPGGGWRRLR